MGKSILLGTETLSGWL